MFSDLEISHPLSDLLREHQKRQEHYTSYVPGALPHWNQEFIHKAIARIYLIFGGNQSGKSQSAAKEIEWRVRGKHPFKTVPKPPILVWCISASYQTLRHGVYRHLINSIPEWEILSTGSKVQGHDMYSYIQCKNGSRIEFYSAKNAEDAREKFQAAKVDVIEIDEEVPQVVYDELRMRQLAAIDPIIIISATLVNSEQYILDLEWRALNGDITQSTGLSNGIALTRLDTRDNPYVNQQVLEDELVHMDEETKTYRIFGKSRRFLGLVYKDFSKEHIIPSFPLPSTWPRVQGIDPGLRTFAVLWMAISPEGKKYIYDELYLHGVNLYEVVDLIRVKEGWILHPKRKRIKRNNQIISCWIPGPKFIPIEERIIDDKTKSRLLTGEWGVLEQLSLTYGIVCTPAIKNRRIGIERCRQSLIDELQVFSNCTNFIREVRSYRYRQDKTRSQVNEAPQEPTKRDDHLLDCWRYIMMTEPEYQEVTSNMQDLMYQEATNLLDSDDEERLVQCSAEDANVEHYRKQCLERAAHFNPELAQVPPLVSSYGI